MQKHLFSQPMSLHLFPVNLFAMTCATHKLHKFNLKKRKQMLLTKL